MTANDATQETAPPLPPLEPASDERPTPENTAFAAESVAALQDLPMIDDWILGKQLVTHSDTWGYIWRADYEFRDKSWAPAVNRLVCFRKPDGKIPRIIAGSQSIPPL